MAKEEERRISPALLIIPVVAALGLAAVAGLAFARAAPPKEYVCPYCGAKFSTEAEVLAHIETEHPEEPPVVYYTCTICGATFTTEEELDTHILSEHPAVGWISPTGHIDPSGAWVNAERAYDDNIDTFASVYSYAYNEPIELTLDSPIECSKVRINADGYGRQPFDYCNPNLSVAVYYEGAYHNIFSGLLGPNYSGYPPRKLWVELSIPAGVKLVSKARITLRENLPFYLWEFDFYKVSEVTAPGGQILDITWWDGANWRPITEPYPAYTYIIHRFRVKNTGDAVGTFKVGYSYYSELMGKLIWEYSPTVDIEAGTEGNIDWELMSGPGTYNITFHLFSNDNDVDSVEVTITVV